MGIKSNQIQPKYILLVLRHFSFCIQPQLSLADEENLLSICYEGNKFLHFSIRGEPISTFYHKIPLSGTIFDSPPPRNSTLLLVISFVKNSLYIIVVNSNTFEL